MSGSYLKLNGYTGPWVVPVFTSGYLKLQPFVLPPPRSGFHHVGLVRGARG